MDSYSGVNQYTFPGVTIFIANRSVFFPAGFHAHQQYEFCMPLGESILAQCENRRIVMEKNQLMPFNAGQPHGSLQDITIPRMICISCTPSYLERLVWTAFSSKYIRFEALSFEVGHTLRFLLGLFIEESLGQKGGYQLMQESLVDMLFTEIIRRSHNNLSNTQRPLHPDTNRGIARAIDFLHEQVTEGFSIQAGAKVAGLSPYHFIRAFKSHTGKTPYAYFLEVKIEKAKELLHDKSLNVLDIALASGFHNCAHFSTVFKRKTGVTPSEYQKMIC